MTDNVKDKRGDEVPRGQRGGVRIGAGRRAKDGAEIVGSVTLSMDALTEAIAHELGDGNYSLGMRRAMAELHDARVVLRDIYRTGHVPTRTVAQKVVGRLRVPTRVIEPDCD